MESAEKGERPCPDALMMCRTSSLIGEEGLADDNAQAKCDEASIAFGVMYFPRMRV
jgi:hypothetical protein